MTAHGFPMLENAVVPSVPQRAEGGFQCPLHGDSGLSQLFSILDSLM